jgi:hypothetical protein
MYAYVHPLVNKLGNLSELIHDTTTQAQNLGRSKPTHSLKCHKLSIYYLRYFMTFIYLIWYSFT